MSFLISTIATLINYFFTYLKIQIYMKFREFQNMDNEKLFYKGKV